MNSPKAPDLLRACLSRKETRLLAQCILGEFEGESGGTLRSVFLTLIHGMILHKSALCRASSQAGEKLSK